MSTDRHGFRYGLLACCLALLFESLLAVPAAAQTTYNVSTVAELETALIAVNAGAGGDLIVLAPGFYPITAALGVWADVTIVGDPSGATVLDGGGDSVLLVVYSNFASIRNLTLQNGNVAIGYGGNGVLAVTGVTIAGCRTGFSPGDAGGATFFTNSTIANNSQDGIVIACAELHLRNVTVTGNGRGVYFDYPCGETMEISNSLIAGNGQDCLSSGYFVAVGDASLDSDGTCAAAGFAPGVATATLAAIGLGSLAANGGPTATEEISPTSVAVNAGDDATCQTTDQRGLLRNAGACDIGAYELGGSPGGSNTPGGANVAEAPAPGVTVTFSQVTAQGDTTATTGGPPPPTGFEIDGVVYDITTTAQFAGPITVCLPYSPSIDPSPRIAHYENVPPPTWVDRTSSVDTTEHVVCGIVSSLSPFAVLMPRPGAGDVGDTLSIEKAGGSDIALSWSGSCDANDDDYGVYEGSLGSWYSHVSRLCSTGGATTVTLTAQVASAYYLIVPRNSSFEGAYGKASSGADIPQGANACAAQQVATSCP